MQIHRIHNHYKSKHKCMINTWCHSYCKSVIPKYSVLKCEAACHLCKCSSSTQQHKISLKVIARQLEIRHHLGSICSKEDIHWRDWLIIHSWGHCSFHIARKFSRCTQILPHSQLLFDTLGAAIWNADRAQTLIEWQSRPVIRTNPIPPVFAHNLDARYAKNDENDLISIIIGGAKRKKCHMPINPSLPPLINKPLPYQLHVKGNCGSYKDKFS